MALDRDELKKLLKEKGVKSLDDFNAFMREVSKAKPNPPMGHAPAFPAQPRRTKRQQAPLIIKYSLTDPAELPQHQARQ